MIDLQKYCDHKAMSGYGSALLYKLPSESLYHLLIPLETVPSVFGSVDTFDFDLLTCKSKGQVEGKETLEQAEVDFLLHRDNVLRLEALQDMTLDFLAVYKDFIARGFTGKIKVRPQDVTGDIARGTLTITPMSASTTTIPDCRDLIQDTVTFGTIPDNLIIDETGMDIEITTDPAFAKTTLSVTNDSSEFEVEITQGVDPLEGAAGKKAKINIKAKQSETKAYDIIYLTGKADGYAEWTTTIMVENKITE